MFEQRDRDPDSITTSAEVDFDAVESEVAALDEAAESELDL